MLRRRRRRRPNDGPRARHHAPAQSGRIQQYGARPAGDGADARRRFPGGRSRIRLRQHRGRAQHLAAPGGALFARRRRSRPRGDARPDGVRARARRGRDARGPGRRRVRRRLEPLERRSAARHARFPGARKIPRRRARLGRPGGARKRANEPERGRRRLDHVRRRGDERRSHRRRGHVRRHAGDAGGLRRVPERLLRRSLERRQEPAHRLDRHRRSRSARSGKTPFASGS